MKLLFHLFSLLDGVTDPDINQLWLGATIEHKKEDDDSEMLHDEFYETYWKYKGE